MRAQILGVTGLSLALLTACVSRGQISVRPDTQVTETEYQVLSVYITRTFTANSGRERVVSQVSKIVIANKTQSDTDDVHDLYDNKPTAWKEITAYLLKKCPALEAVTLDSFREVNTHPANFHPLFRLPVKCELIDESEFDRIFEKGGWWKDYYKKYPDSQGFLTLSRVGFNPDGDQALFYATNGCGGKCGTGSYVVMQRIGSNWRILKEIIFWIS
jgi:hypothetical protein